MSRSLLTVVITFLTLVALATAALAADVPSGAAGVPCSQNAPSNATCQPSKHELKEAKKTFAQGLRLQKEKQPEEAFEKFKAASELAPGNVDYVTAREMARQELVYNHVEQGNNDLAASKQIEAMAEFRHALELDPQNAFAQQRLNDALSQWAPDAIQKAPTVEYGGEIHVQPKNDRLDFSFRGDSHELLTQVASSFGVSAVLDETVPSRHLRFDMEHVNFEEAMSAACSVTKTFWAPLSDRQIVVAADTKENRAHFERMALRTFYLPNVITQTEMTDIVNTLRGVFEIRYITPQLGTSTIVVRAPQTTLDEATKILEGLDNVRPQVLLDIKLFEVNHMYTRNIGLQIPSQFKLFNIPAGALAALGGQNIQDLVNQLISGGGINQANSQSLSALLAQLQSQQNSIFSQPVATFGGGLTLMGLSLGTGMVNMSMNESSVKTLEHVTLRASQGTDATFRAGSRIPILNASFAPVFNSSAISQVIQNNSFQAPFPSFSYEDIGLTLKAKPEISADLNVTLQLEMEFRTLAGQSENGIPVIANREFKGSISLLNGEPAVIAGAVTKNEQKSLSGIPGLGKVPLLNKVMANNTKEDDEDELLLVITPHVTSRNLHGNHEDDETVWLPRN